MPKYFVNPFIIRCVVPAIIFVQYSFSAPFWNTLSPIGNHHTSNLYICFYSSTLLIDCHASPPLKLFYILIDIMFSAAGGGINGAYCRLLCSMSLLFKNTRTVWIWLSPVPYTFFSILPFLLPWMATDIRGVYNFY